MFPACKNNFLLCSLNQKTQLLFDFKMVVMYIAASLNDQSSTSRLCSIPNLTMRSLLYPMFTSKVDIRKSVFRHTRSVPVLSALCSSPFYLYHNPQIPNHTIPRYPIFNTRYSAMCKVYTGLSCK